MPLTIFCTRQPADATQQGHLQTLFLSPGFSLLKEMVAARCIECQTMAMNSALYDQNELAKAKAEEEQRRACVYGALLDMLDDFENEEDQWFTVKLDNRR